MVEFALEQNNQHLESVDTSDHYDRDKGKDTRCVRSGDISKVPDVEKSSGLDHGAKQINNNDKAHAKKAETTELLNHHELKQIVNG